MTAVVEPGTQTGVGRVVRVIGPVVDAEFPRAAKPAMTNALPAPRMLRARPGHTLTAALTPAHAERVGVSRVRSISMQPTDGLVRGTDVRDTGGPITVPVGDVT